MRIPHVSIIVLNYINYTETINCVSQLLIQQYPTYDIVIVDNGSPNDSFNILKETFKSASKVFVIRSERNLGYGGGNNYGINWRIARGEVDYFFIVNNDVYIEDISLLSKLVMYAESINDLAVIGPKVVLPNGYIQGPYGRPNPFILTIQYLLPPIWLFLRYLRQIRIKNIKQPQRVYRTIGACMLVKARPFISVGGFDEELFMQGEENVLAEKLMRIGLYYYYYPPVSVIHNHPVSSTSKLNLKKKMFVMNVENTAYYFKKYRDVPDWVIRFYKFAARSYLLFFYDLAEFFKNRGVMLK